MAGAGKLVGCEQCPGARGQAPAARHTPHTIALMAALIDGRAGECALMGVYGAVRGICSARRRGGGERGCARGRATGLCLDGL